MDLPFPVTAAAGHSAAVTPQAHQGRGERHREPAPVQGEDQDAAGLADRCQGHPQCRRAKQNLGRIHHQG